MIRIIGGRWKKKSLTVLDKTNLRPTPSRVRETVFNWLNSIINLSESTVLDLFCGSGALGMEAASRGAKQVKLVDSDESIIENLNVLIDSLGSPRCITTECEDAISWLNLNRHQKFDLIFLDPPFNSLLITKTLPILFDRINDGGLIYVEFDKEANFLFDSLGFEVIRSSKSGSVRYYLIMKKQFLKTSI